MSVSQSRIKKMLCSIQNLLGLHICIKRKPSEVKKADEKLMNIFNELTVGISEVFEDKPQAFDEYLRCDKVSCKISVLSEQIGQVRILYSLWKNGYDLDPQELISKLQSLNLLVDCIRDDVFYAYLQLPPEQKLQLLKKNKQVSAIFAVLGTLENEVSEMMKTMFPNDELMKALKPLLKPNFNQVIYKRQAKNFCSYDYSSPIRSNLVQFSCKKVTCKKPKLVDAWTNPIEQDWDYYGGPYGNANSSNSLVKGLEPVHRTHQTGYTQTKNSACQASLAEDTNYEGFLIMESTVTLNELKSQDGVSVDRLSIVTADINDVTSSHHSFFQHQDSLTCSQECLEENGFGPQQGLSFWKIAADMIADQPAKS